MANPLSPKSPVPFVPSEGIAAHREANITAPLSLKAYADVDHLELVEIFHSIQGEGPLTGVPATFVRFAKCNLQCLWCDTLWNRVNIRMSNDELAEYLRRRGPTWIIYTGGEPCLQLQRQLTSQLQATNTHQAVETNGTVWTDALLDMDHITISPKAYHPIHTEIQGYFSEIEKIDQATGQHIQTELRFIICNEEDDLFDTGINDRVDWITFSPLMHAIGPPPKGWRPGDGSPGLLGAADATTLQRCIELVHKHRYRNARLSVQLHKFLGVR